MSLNSFKVLTKGSMTQTLVRPNRSPAFLMALHPSLKMSGSLTDHSHSPLFVYGLKTVGERLVRRGEILLSPDFSDGWGMC